VMGLKSGDFTEKQDEHLGQHAQADTHRLLPPAGSSASETLREGSGKPCGREKAAAESAVSFS
jgi:hypothetical protein